MQPTILTVNNARYRVFRDGNNILHPAGNIEIYAVRRVTNLALNASKTIDFTDLQDSWELESCWISTPETSEIKIEILNSAQVVIYSDTFLRDQTPINFSTILIDSTMTVRVTALRAAISSILIYLKPAHLAHSKDF